MKKILLIVVLTLLLVSSQQKTLTVSCTLNCSIVTNCAAACLSYTGSGITTQYCLNATTTGGIPILKCPVGLPLTFEVVGCTGSNVPTCLNGSGCCLQVNYNTQCVSAFQATTCAATPLTTSAICGTCQQTPSCTNNLCVRYSVNNVFVQEKCIPNPNLCEVYSQTMQTCSTTSCTGGCCGSGNGLVGVCYNTFTFNNFGLLGKQLCTWGGFQGILIKYIAISLALAFMLLI